MTEPEDATPPRGMAVIVVNWRDEARTLRCIAALRGWSSLPVRLIVVDNESTDESRQALSEALGPDELICEETNLGFGGGNNRGLARALADGADAVLLLNSDAEIAEEAVRQLADRLEADPHVSILGPVICERHHGQETRYAGGRDIARSLYTRIPADEGASAQGATGPRHEDDGPLREVDYVPGTVVLVKRSVFEDVGLLDESFFFSGEIADLCKRAANAGHRSFVDLNATARHDTDLTPQDLRDTLYVYYSLRNRILYGRKHQSSGLVRHLGFWATMCLLECGRAAARGHMRKARAVLLALAHGTVNRSGNQNAAFV